MEISTESAEAVGEARLFDGAVAACRRPGESSLSRGQATAGPQAAYQDDVLAKALLLLLCTIYTSMNVRYVRASESIHILYLCI